MPVALLPVSGDRGAPVRSAVRAPRPAVKEEDLPARSTALSFVIRRPGRRGLGSKTAAPRAFLDQYIQLTVTFQLSHYFHVITETEPGDFAQCMANDVGPSLRSGSAHGAAQRRSDARPPRAVLAAVLACTRAVDAGIVVLFSMQKLRQSEGRRVAQFADSAVIAMPFPLRNAVACAFHHLADGGSRCQI